MQAAASNNCGAAASAAVSVSVSVTVVSIVTSQTYRPTNLFIRTPWVPTKSVLISRCSFKDVA